MNPFACLVMKTTASILPTSESWPSQASATVFRGDIVLDLPEGGYRVAAFSPATGLYSPWIEIAGGNDTRVRVPEFSHDIVVRILRR